MKSHLKTGILAAFTLAIISISAVAQTGKVATDPTGTWKWNVANPDGRIPDLTLALKLEGEKLSGTITKSSGATAITNGACKAGKVSFQTVSEGKAGKSVITYSGTLGGDKITGQVEVTTATGKTFTSEWEVKRVKQ